MSGSSEELILKLWKKGYEPSADDTQRKGL